MLFRSGLDVRFGHHVQGPASQLASQTYVLTESDIQAKQQAETGDILRNFIEELEVDEDLAQVLA